jgi:hypothetical protein
MSADFRLRCGFLEQSKWRELKKLIGAEGVLCQIRLVSHAALYKAEGVLTDMSIKQIEVEAIWRGDPGEFVCAAVTAKLIDKPGEGDNRAEWYKINDWKYYSPKDDANAQVKTERAKKAAASRWGKRHTTEIEETPVKPTVVEPEIEHMPIILPSANDLTLTASPVARVSRNRSKRIPRQTPADVTHEDAEAYAVAQGYDKCLGDEFLDYQLARGWMMGNKILIVDWKAAFRTYVSNARKWGHPIPKAAASLDDTKKPIPKIVKDFMKSQDYRIITDYFAAPHKYLCRPGFKLPQVPLDVIEASAAAGYDFAAHLEGRS